MGGDSKNSARVAWVKLGCVWWPGKVLNGDELTEEMKNEVEAAKKAKRKDVNAENIHVVKYFNEDDYVVVSKPQEILLEVSEEKKMDIVKRAMNTMKSPSSALHSRREEFKTDVLYAEKFLNPSADLTDLTRLLNGETVEQKKVGPSKYADIFPSAKPEKPILTSPQTSGAGKGKAGSVKFNFTSSRIINVASTKSPNKIAPLPSDPSKKYKCMKCLYSSDRVNVITAHMKHCTGPTKGQQAKRASAPPKVESTPSVPSPTTTTTTSTPKTKSSTVAPVPVASSPPKTNATTPAANPPRRPGRPPRKSLPAPVTAAPAPTTTTKKTATKVAAAASNSAPAVATATPKKRGRKSKKDKQSSDKQKAEILQDWNDSSSEENDSDDDLAPMMPPDKPPELFLFGSEKSKKRKAAEPVTSEEKKEGEGDGTAKKAEGESNEDQPPVLKKPRTDKELSDAFEALLKNTKPEYEDLLKKDVPLKDKNEKEAMEEKMEEDEEEEPDHQMSDIEEDALIVMKKTDAVDTEAEVDGADKKSESGVAVADKPVDDKPHAEAGRDNQKDKEPATNDKSAPENQSKEEKPPKEEKQDYKESKEDAVKKSAKEASPTPVPQSPTKLSPKKQVRPLSPVPSAKSTTQTKPIDNKSPTKSIDNKSPTKSIDNKSPTKSIDNKSPTKSVDNKSPTKVLDAPKETPATLPPASASIVKKIETPVVAEKKEEVKETPPKASPSPISPSKTVSPSVKAPSPRPAAPTSPVRSNSTSQSTRQQEKEKSIETPATLPPASASVAPTQQKKTPEKVSALGNNVEAVAKPSKATPPASSDVKPATPQKVSPPQQPQTPVSQASANKAPVVVEQEKVKESPATLAPASASVIPTQRNSPEKKVEAPASSPAKTPSSQVPLTTSTPAAVTSTPSSVPTLTAKPATATSTPQILKKPTAAVRPLVDNKEAIPVATPPPPSPVKKDGKIPQGVSNQTPAPHTKLAVSTKEESSQPAGATVTIAPSSQQQQSLVEDTAEGSDKKSSPGLVSQRVVHLVPVENADGSITYMLLSLENGSENPGVVLDQGATADAGAGTVLRLDKVESMEHGTGTSTHPMNQSEVEGIFLDKGIDNANQIVSALAAASQGQSESTATTSVMETAAYVTLAVDPSTAGLGLATGAEDSGTGVVAGQPLVLPEGSTHTAAQEGGEQQVFYMTEDGALLDPQSLGLTFEQLQQLLNQQQ